MGINNRIINFASKLDLGRTYDDYGCCGPGALTGSASKPKVYYPSLYVDGKKEAIELPDSGKAVVEYKVTRRASETRDGKTRHDATIEIQSLEPVKDGKAAKKALPNAVVPIKMPGRKRGFSALGPRMINFERSRDGAGQFAPESGDGGIDANTMAAAYGHPAQRSSSHVGGKAVVAMGSGAAAVLLGRKLRGKMGR